MPSLADLVARLDAWYPPHTADSWDAVGLVSGHPDDAVRKVLLAVDVTPEVAAEAAEWGADLLITHHPLFLKPVNSVAATTPKGRTLHTLQRAGCALFTAHTNADQADDGVSAALATALGLAEQQPILPAPSAPMDKLVVYVPTDAAAIVRAAIAEAGAGAIGNYDFASFSSTGEGRFRPLEGAQPTIGEVGEIETVEEIRIEVVLPRPLRADVVRAMVQAHPYETPAYQVQELADAGVAGTGTGRIGTITRMPLAEFAGIVVDALPETTTGVRVAGDPERSVRRIAVCGGAGDFLLDAVRRTDADVYVTSDLRHHPAAEFIEHDGPALIDVAHWAAESTWLPVLADRLTETVSDIDVRVSGIVTDPWNLRPERTVE